MILVMIVTHVPLVSVVQERRSMCCRLCRLSTPWAVLSGISVISAVLSLFCPLYSLYFMPTPLLHTSPSLYGLNTGDTSHGPRDTRNSLHQSLSRGMSLVRFLVQSGLTLIFVLSPGAGLHCPVDRFFPWHFRRHTPHSPFLLSGFNPRLLLVHHRNQ